MYSDSHKKVLHHEREDEATGRDGNHRGRTRRNGHRYKCRRGLGRTSTAGQFRSGGSRRSRPAGPPRRTRWAAASAGPSRRTRRVARRQPRAWRPRWPASWAGGRRLPGTMAWCPVGRRSPAMGLGRPASAGMEWAIPAAVGAAATAIRLLGIQRDAGMGSRFQPVGLLALWGMDPAVRTNHRTMSPLALGELTFAHTSSFYASCNVRKVLWCRYFARFAAQVGFMNCGDPLSLVGAVSRQFLGPLWVTRQASG